MADADGEYSPKLQKRTLRGHRGPVLCLAHSSERLAYYPTANQQAPSSEVEQPRHHHPNLLLSGSEDGTARLWDLRTRRTALCMVLPRGDDGEGCEVTSVAFHPSIAEERRVDEANADDANAENKVNNASAVRPMRHDCTVYASSAHRVYGYDLRYHSTTSASVPIINNPHFDLTSHFRCADEINQLSFSYPRKNDGSGTYLMSAADDSGEVHVIDCPPHRYDPKSTNATTAKKHRAIQHSEPHTLAIASAAIFQPRTNNETYLATGGTDCTIKLWDASRPRKPTCTLPIQPDASENATQLCNPPYVHSLSWSPSGRLLCAGIGDGSIAIYRAEGRRVSEIGRLGLDAGGHGSAVAGVCFPGFGLCDGDSLPTAAKLSAKVRKSGVAEDRLVLSAGNDGNIIFWDLGGNMVEHALDPTVYLAKCLSPPLTEEEQEVQEAARKLKEMRMTGPDLQREWMPSPPRVLFRIGHGHKPNWITCNRACDAVLPNSVFVADTTNNVSVYTLPL